MPSIVKGRLWGGIASRGHERRLPSTRITASAAAPALMCTTAPPAKSSAPRLNSHPFGLNTQWATTGYTMTDHTPMRIAYALNFKRSAVAPVMSAGVITANIIW